MKVRNWLAAFGSKVRALGAGPTPGRLVAGLGGVFIVGVVALAGYDMLATHRATVEQVRVDLDTQSRVIAEQTARTVQAIDTVLRHLAEQSRRGGFDRLDVDGLHAYLQEQTVGLVQIDGLAIFNVDGTARAATMVPRAQLQHLNATQLPAFQRLRDNNNAGLAIGATFKSDSTGRHVIPIGRRLIDAQGELGGIVGAGGRVDYFQAFYRDAYPAAGTRIALLHRDGTLLARHPPADAALGNRLDAAELRTLTPDAPATSTRASSPVDGSDRFASLRLVPDYPLVVVVSRESGAALAPWRAQAIGSGLRTLAMAALAGWLIALAVRHLARLRASEDRFAVAVAGSADGIWVIDFGPGTAYASERAREIFGAGWPELQSIEAWNQRMDARLEPADQLRRQALIDAHLAGETPFYEFEYRVREATDRARWIRARGKCTRDAHGKPVRFAGSVSDIDEKKNAEAERAHLEAQLRQAQKLEAIGTLAGGIAHDFNNILSAILGYGEMAQKGAGDGTPTRRHIDAVMSAGLRAKSLVERILAFSRGGVTDKVPVHVASAVDEALAGIQAQLPPGVRLERSTSNPDLCVLGDATQVHQVVMNLCANAVHAMRAGGGVLSVAVDELQFEAPRMVATSTLPAGHYVRLAVSDTGSGIAPQVLERIFDPFFTTKEVGVGTGLGLSLVHGIVADLGGGIAVESRVGHGTTFTVYMPWHRYVAAPRPADERVVQGDGEAVLLVDDEESLVRLGEEMLAELGYEPVGFASSVAALAAFRADPDRFAAVLTDESMPDLSGIELSAEIRRVRPTLPIVLMSGFVNPQIAARANEAGIVDVLTKPLVSRDIARSLAAALGH